MTRPQPDTSMSEALSAWLDGELDEAEAAEIEAELARDPALRADLEELEGVVRLLREEGPTEAPMNFHAQVMARVEEEHPAGGWSLTRWLGVRWEALAIGFAAVAALLLVIPMSMDERPSPELVVPEDATTSPAVAAPTPSSSLRGSSGGGEAPAAEDRERTVADQKLESTTPQVIGRATSGGTTAKVPSEPAAAPDANVAGGTSDEGAVQPELDGVPRPEVAIEAGLAGEERSWRTVVRSDDAGMKRKVLSVGSRYGVVTDTSGATVTSATMGSSREQLVVTLPQTQLAAFQQELRALGLTVESQAPTDLTDAGPVEVKVTLQLTGGAGTSTEDPKAAPAAARKAMDALEVER
ncbi:MAG: hypothetical protein H6735_26380 [Alphaproteobacteria bacterium]|nr:hypothetical protein [Alphaproteobacteria bacterium]